MELGNKIKNIRHNNNMSQEELAKILKINRNNLSRIETNKSLPTAEVLYRFANYFNISIDSLLGINLNDQETSESKKNKVKKITQQCMYLTNTDLDFILNMIYVMTNNNKIRL